MCETCASLSIDLVYNKLCLNCVAPCVTCTSNVDCKTCDGTLYLGENRCVEP